LLFDVLTTLAVVFLLMQPLATRAASDLAALILAGLADWWLGHSTVAPLKRFAVAATVLGRGATPERLPETGPRELACLARSVSSTRVRASRSSSSKRCSGPSTGWMPPAAQ
jgi:hypothetical protein